VRSCLTELLLALSDVGLRRDPSRRHIATAEVTPNPTYKTYAATVRLWVIFSYTLLDLNVNKPQKTEYQVILSRRGESRLGFSSKLIDTSKYRTDEEIQETENEIIKLTEEIDDFTVADYAFSYYDYDAITAKANPNLKSKKLQEFDNLKEILEIVFLNKS